MSKRLDLAIATSIKAAEALLTACGAIELFFEVNVMNSKSSRSGTTEMKGGLWRGL